MGRIGTFFVGAAIGGLAIYGSLQYHLVRADDGMHLVGKTEVTFKDFYVDVREFGPSDWIERPALAMAIMRSGKRELIHGSAVDAVNASLQDFLTPQD